MPEELLKKIKKIREQSFDAEGSGYDYKSATKHGLKPDKTGHYPSRIPQTGLLLKGRKHKTWHLTEEGERKAGHRIIKKGNRYFSIKNNSQIIRKIRKNLNK